MSSCDQISNEIAALSAAIAALDGKYVKKSEVPGIIADAVRQAKALIDAALAPLKGAIALNHLKISSMMHLLPDTKILRRFSRRFPNFYFPFEHPSFPFRHRTHHEILCLKWEDLGYYHFHRAKYFNRSKALPTFIFPHPDFEKAYFAGCQEAFYESEDSFY